MNGSVLRLLLPLLPFLSLLRSTCLSTEPGVPQRVPRMQVIPLPYERVTFEIDGRDFAVYHFDRDLRRPFIFPVIGTSGRSLTRMGHPHDAESHSHHNSVWISHNDVNGDDFWGDRGAGRIVHQRVLEYADGDDDGLFGGHYERRRRGHYADGPPAEPGSSDAVPRP